MVYFRKNALTIKDCLNKKKKIDIFILNVCHLKLFEAFMINIKKEKHKNRKSVIL